MGLRVVLAARCRCGNIVLDKMVRFGLKFEVKDFFHQYFFRGALS